MKNSMTDSEEKLKKDLVKHLDFMMTRIEKARSEYSETENRSGESYIYAYGMYKGSIESLIDSIGSENPWLYWTDGSTAMDELKNNHDKIQS